MKEKKASDLEISEKQLQIGDLEVFTIDSEGNRVYQQNDSISDADAEKLKNQ